MMQVEEIIYWQHCVRANSYVGRVLHGLECGSGGALSEGPIQYSNPLHFPDRKSFYLVFAHQKVEKKYVFYLSYLSVCDINFGINSTCSSLRFMDNSIRNKDLPFAVPVCNF